MLTALAKSVLVPLTQHILIALELNIFQEKLKRVIGNKNITTNIYRIQAYDSILCGHFCIGFINFLLKDKTLLDYTNLFSPNEQERNDKITLKYLIIIYYIKEY